MGQNHHQTSHFSKDWNQDLIFFGLLLAAALFLSLKFPQKASPYSAELPAVDAMVVLDSLVLQASTDLESGSLIAKAAYLDPENLNPDLKDCFMDKGSNCRHYQIEREVPLGLFGAAGEACSQAEKCKFSRQLRYTLNCPADHQCVDIVYTIHAHSIANPEMSRSVLRGIDQQSIRSWWK